MVGRYIDGGKISLGTRSFKPGWIWTQIEVVRKTSSGGAMAITVLNVAEKPSVAKAVAGIVSNNQMRSRNGRSVYNKIYEFNYNIQNHSCQM
ncbi:hypothetical protein DM860_011034 [Cuscuta australis]|uniref:DNA topoisomerase n=1 Tax=Cuscuta australis TaxID=267555 RepID=A0A328E0M8_9ASTE|nr:hypothetical protein DM860_011034 [Cuscuta australis]